MVDHSLRSFWDGSERVPQLGQHNCGLKWLRARFNPRNWLGPSIAARPYTASELQCGLPSSLQGKVPTQNKYRESKGAAVALPDQPEKICIMSTIVRPRAWTRVKRSKLSMGSLHYWEMLQ